MTDANSDRRWLPRARKVAMGVIFAFLLASCSSGDPENDQGAQTSSSEPSASSASSSAPKAEAETVVQRDEPLYKRVNYPVKGAGDPS
ncbi:MAG: hypothetical protein L0G59_04840, partial [Kocuria sp.]|nr:hypothetical protein [Kocuria sp.]